MPRRSSPSALVTLVLFLVVVIGVGGTIGVLTAPGAWYESLAKPPFNPPNWLFGPVWTLLYIFIAIAGWRMTLRAPRSAAMRWWVAQMLLNWVWTPVWFALHLLWPAFAIIIAMLAAIIGFIVTTWREDRTSAVLFLPYAAWVGFASLLNLSIAILN
jgi:tryptophan-rich sensory protein